MDDEPELRQTLRLVLEDEGYTVYEAAEGGEGLVHLQAVSTPTIAIVGIVMPGMDGWEMLRRVAADTTLASRHRYIVMTGFFYHEIGDNNKKLLNQLDAPFLSKPFNIESLLDVVAQTCAKLTG